MLVCNWVARDLIGNPEWISHDYIVHVVLSCSPGSAESASRVHLPARGTEQVSNLTFAIINYYIASICSVSIDLTTRLIAENIKYRKWLLYLLCTINPQAYKIKKNHPKPEKKFNKESPKLALLSRGLSPEAKEEKTGDSTVKLQTQDHGFGTRNRLQCSQTLARAK